MLGREQFTDRKQAILNMSNNDDKPTLKVAVGFLLKSAAKNMKGTYLVEGNDQKAKDMDTFLAILDLEWSCLFSKALWKIDERKQEHLRRPRQLPLEDDVEKINTWMTREIDRLLNQYTICGQFEYNRLRAICVSRLTLFNSRRGGEPARLLLKELQDAENGCWVDPQLVETIEDPLRRNWWGNFS